MLITLEARTAGVNSPLCKALIESFAARLMFLGVVLSSETSPKTTNACFIRSPYSSLFFLRTMINVHLLQKLEQPSYISFDTYLLWGPKKMPVKTGDTYIKRMADLLRQGATLTDLACPVCSSPLFRLQDGTLWCGKDEKKVVVVKEGEEPTQTNTVMDKLEATLMTKVQKLQDKIEKTDNTEEIGKLTMTLSELLNSLEKVKKIKKS